MNRINYFNLLFCLFFTLNFIAVSAEESCDLKEVSQVTQQAFKKFKKIDDELSGYGNEISELLLNCSYIQDVCIAYLNDAESVEEYHRGMELFASHSSRFKSICNYATTIFNFYTGSFDSPKPETVKIAYNGKSTWGYLNTFKMDYRITDEERWRFYYQEYFKYCDDAIAHPFVLNESTVDDLEANTLYNFVLLPEGTIIAALEKPREKEYQVRDEVIIDAFNYPNHTILAGAPDQVVVTAGAFIFQQVDEKRLFFVSCKSGHFQPSYDSLEHVKTQLGFIGINPHTIISVPDVDISRALIKTYKGAKVPLLLTKEDSARLFQQAQERWQKCYPEISREVLSSLSQGDLKYLDAQLIATIRKQRGESTYMRSAYHLFSGNHQASETFSDLVKRFGKLKDAIKHFGNEKFKIAKVQSEASQVLELLDKYEAELQAQTFQPADDVSIQVVLAENIAEMRDLLDREDLTTEEYHQLKKLSREMGSLFMYLAEDAKWKPKGFHIYRTASEAFFQINDLMAKTNYTYSSQVSDEDNNEERVIVSRKIKNLLTKCIDHIGLAPASYEIEIDSKEAWWMINNSKEYYFLLKRVYDCMRMVGKGEINEQSMDFDQLLANLKWLKEEVKIARNAMIFLDTSHQVPESFIVLMQKVDQVIDKAESRDFDWIKAEAYDLVDIFYHSPSPLEKWTCTDQHSFNRVLEANLNQLSDFQTEAIISIDRVKEIIDHVQAFRDLINLHRQNGLFKKADRTQPHVPIVYFDALEERADALIDELRDTIENDVSMVLVTPTMIRNAEFIKSRILTP